MTGVQIAVVGATGAVGDVLLEILSESNLPIKKLVPLSSDRSAGQDVHFRGESITVLNASSFDFTGIDIAFFSAGASVSLELAPKAVAAGCLVIDNTSAFRYNSDTPLVIPEINPDALDTVHQSGIVANPNCSTIQMLVAVNPIYRQVGLQRINVATYQSVSGAGQRAISELATQTAALLNGQPVEPEVLSQQIAFNAIPHIDEFQDNGYTKEEMKMVWETQKILNDPDVLVNPTAVRIPVFYGHSEAIHLETQDPFALEDIYHWLANAPGIGLMDSENEYPTVIEQAANQDLVWVGRIRRDISHATGLNLWCVADNIRKGAATNAVQIAEQLLQKQLVAC